MGLIERLFGTAGPAEKRNFSISDPAFAAWLKDQGIALYDGTDTAAMGLSAFYRGASLIAGTIASLPLKVYTENSKGKRKEVDSWLSHDPANPYDISRFNWVETIVLHLICRGETYLAHVPNGAGVVQGLLPIHPQAVTKVEWAGTDKQFTVQLDDGTQKTFDSSNMTQIVEMSTDSLRGTSRLSVFAKTIQTSLAGESQANSSFVNGLKLAGLVTPDADMELADAVKIKESLDAKSAESPGGWAVVNRHLTFSPMSMTAEDGQFLQSRQFQVEEIARILGIPMNLLSVNGAISNWGTGQAEANLGLQKYTLMPFTSRIEEALSEVLPEPQFAEFDYHGLLQGTPSQEIELLISQVDAGILTKDEARAFLNLGPLPPTATPPAPEAPQGAPTS